MRVSEQPGTWTSLFLWIIFRVLYLTKVNCGERGKERGGWGEGLEVSVTPEPLLPFLKGNDSRSTLPGIVPPSEGY